MSGGITEWLRTTVAPWIKAGLDPLHAFLNGLPPWSWRAAMCAYLVLGVLWGVFLTKAYIYRGAPTQALWRDLRLWLPLLLLPYLLAYLFL